MGLANNVCVMVAVSAAATGAEYLNWPFVRPVAFEALIEVALATAPELKVAVTGVVGFSEPLKFKVIVAVAGAVPDVLATPNE